MSLSIADIARMHKEFIYEQLTVIEHELHYDSEENQELVRRAIFSVRNKSVIFEKYNTLSSTLHAQVQDVRTAIVVIDFNKHQIECSCFAKGIVCRHTLAVLLSLYQYFDSVQDWLNNWKQSKATQVTFFSNDYSPLNWRQLINDQMERQLKSNRRIEGYAVMTFAELMRNRLQRFTPYEREWVPMFKLFAELRIFIHIMNLNSDKNFVDANQQYYIDYFADKSCEKISTYVNELATQKRNLAYEPFFLELQKMAFELLSPSTQSNKAILSMYLVIWKKLLIQNVQIESELQHIKAWKEENQNDAIYYVRIFPIELLFNLLVNNMQEAELLLKAIQQQSIESLLLVAEFLLDVGNTKASERILRALLPFMHSYISEYIPFITRHTTAHKINQLFEKINLSEEEQMLYFASLGKYGLDPFSDFLLNKQRYTDWVALHQMYSSSLEFTESSGLNEVLKHAPEAILPLFHHFAMEELKHKSRTNYKAAVRIWKKMRTAAKNAGKQTYFEEYMRVIRSDYKRLRALQEELDKANL